MERALRIVLAAMALAAFPMTSKAAPCAGFLDVDDTSGFCGSVTWMKNRAITLGCSATLYCPDTAVTRLRWRRSSTDSDSRMRS